MRTDDERDTAAFTAWLESLPAESRTRSDAPPNAAVYRNIDMARDRANAIQARRRDSLQLVAFIAGSGLFLSALSLAFANGYAIPILAVQGAAFFTLPFTAVIALRRKIMGGYAWTV